MTIVTKILKNQPKLNANGQYKFDEQFDGETNLGVSGDFNSKFIDDDLYTTNLKNQVNEDILSNDWDLIQQTELKLSVKVGNAGVGGNVKSIRFKVSLFDEGHPLFKTQEYGDEVPFLSPTFAEINSTGEFYDNTCERSIRQVDDNGNFTFDEEGNPIYTPQSYPCDDKDFYQHYKNLIQDNEYKIFDKSFEQQSNTWNPEPLINDDVILTNFYDDNLTTEYNDDFSSDANQSFNIGNLNLSTEDYTSIGTSDNNNFYLVVYMQGHKDLFIGTDRRDSRIQVFKLRKRDFKFELNDSGNLEECSVGEEPATNPNCYDEGGTYYKIRTSTYVVSQVYDDSDKYRGNEGGGLGAEAPAFKCNEVKLEITPPYFTTGENRIPEEYKNIIQYPINLNNSEYERFFELSPNKLINFSVLNGENLDIDFITFSNITTLENDLQRYYFDFDKMFLTSAPNTIDFNLSVEATNRTLIDNDDLGFAFFVIDWNDNDKKYEDWESVLAVIPQTFSATYIKQQQDNLFILKGINQNGNLNTFSEVGNLQHFYRTSGLKTIKSVVFSYAKDNNDRIQAIRWKLVTSRIFLNENRVTKEDFSELGTLGFTTIPWPYTTPIISGVSKLSKYYDSVENTLFNNKFADDELLSETKVYNALINDMDEMGDFIGDVDIEQTRFFSGAYDMDQLLMIENMMGEELITDDWISNGSFVTQIVTNDGGFRITWVSTTDQTYNYRIYHTDIFETGKQYRISFEIKGGGKPINNGIQLKQGTGGTRLTFVENVPVTSNFVQHTYDVVAGLDTEADSQDTHINFAGGSPNPGWDNEDDFIEIRNVSVTEILTDVDDSTYNPYYDIYDEETNPSGYWGNTNFYPDFDESCVGLIFISDSSNTTLKQNCLIELNMGDVEDGDSIIDTSGNSNIGLLIGDYTIKKESTLVPLVRDSEMKLPETENDNRAI